MSGLESISMRRLRKFPLLQPLLARDFRLFWTGQSVSLFGDQFYLVALPWLVLALTGSSLALGAVLLVSGAVRAAFQLLGGALSDRLSPRTLMLASNATGAIVTAFTAAVVFLGAAQPWHLYILGAIFGLIEAMFYPAYMSATPLLLAKEQLVAGNALLRSTTRLMGIIGPATAGFVVAKLGYGPAFALDAATFVFAASMLCLMRVASPHDEQQDDKLRSFTASAAKSGLFASIAEGMRYTWGSAPLKMLFLFLGLFEFAVGGSIRVGLPALAKQQFGAEKGPEMYGWMASSFAVGVLIGMVLSGSLDISKLRGKLMFGSTVVMGFSLMLLGFSTRLAEVCALLVVIGVGAGAVSIIVQAWIQMITDKRVLGRVMSLLMLGIAIMEMFSFVLAGSMADLNLHLVFVGSGAVTLIASVITFTSRTIRAKE